MKITQFLFEQPGKFILTITGIAFCTLLFLFLFSIYNGAFEGSIDYVKNTDVDLWVLQDTASNILRQYSILSLSKKRILSNLEGIKKVTPWLVLLSSVKIENGYATLYIMGYDTKSGIGAPPLLWSGRTIQRDDEIIIDKAFSKKYKKKLGDQILIQDKMLTVVGISTGTNALVIQFAFISFACAQSFLPFPGIVSAFLVHVEQGKNIEVVKKNIIALNKNLNVFNHDEFVKNNVAEMENGFLPVLYIITLMGGIVLTIILSLILTINVMEKRKDFAILKILGCKNSYLLFFIIRQSFLLVTTGAFFGVILLFPIVVIVQEFLPETNCIIHLFDILIVFVSVEIIALLSGIISSLQLKKIYLLEVFEWKK